MPPRTSRCGATRCPWGVMLVVLQDGRQLEGELHTLTSRYHMGGVVFEPWEIETLEDVS
jgi:hypothetical protein